MTDTPNLDALLKLPAGERLALAEALWSSLTTVDTSETVADWHLKLISERVAEDDADPAAVQDFAEVCRKIAGQ
ncbi:MAG: addiction module protein [Hyphomicrobium aestuarii]|nr:addiction module protein [Hyphomicrobium aestuarii]